MKYMPDYSSRFRILKGGKISLVISALVAGATISSASPVGGEVTTGSATISGSSTVLNINQSTQKASINWQSFSIAPNETVNFIQPSSSSVTLNRVIGTTDSLIEGAMNANGHVFLINPNGIVFAKGSQVNVGGLVASTLNITDKDFQDGNYHFEGNSQSSILNMGTITASDGGYVAMIGKNVQNEGVIAATLGNVQLAGGSAFTLNLNGNSLLKLTIDQGTLDALVANKGIIKADGGQVYLTTRALDTVLNGLVNNTGVIEANSIGTKNGEIVLYTHGGTTELAGTLSATDGFIETSGDVFSIAPDTVVNTGDWLIDPVDLSINAALAGTTVTSLNGGTNVTLTASNDISVDAAMSWNNNVLTLSAGNNININAQMDLTNTAGIALNSYAYNVNAPVNIASTGSFSFNGINYNIINALGAQGSIAGIDLQGISGALASRFVLGSNIDASATGGWNAGAGFVPIGNDVTPFTGIFDGLGHTISNLTINTPSVNNVGLFGRTGVGSVIKNIGLLNTNITGASYVAGLVGYSASSITNSYTTGSVSGTDKVGGLVGTNAGLIINSYATQNISSTGNYVGGLVGHSGNSITNSYATGGVSGQNYVGGLVGYNTGSITNSYATGSVGGLDSVGGLVGYSANAITISYATGGVSGTDKVGGLVGYNDGLIQNTYATGSVTGNVTGHCGGIVGINNSTITLSYATGRVSGGGFVGRNSGILVSNYWDIDTTGKSYGFWSNYGQIFYLTGVHSTTGTINAFNQATYANLIDFTSIWVVYEGYTRPLLRSFMTALDVTANDVTRVYDATAYADPDSVTYSTAYDPSLVSGSLSYADNNTNLTDVGTVTITPSGLYSSQQGYLITYNSGTLVTTPKEITVSASNKVYDATTNAKFTTADIITGDTVSLGGTATFADKNVGTAKTVSISGLSISGTDAGNYVLTGTTATDTADITAKSITVSATAANKIYDASTAATATLASAGIIAGDTVALSSTTTTFADKNVGTAKTVTVSGLSKSGTDAGNYVLTGTTATDTADITAKSITVSATAANKIYDASTAATATLASADIISGDTVSLGGTATFADKNVGSAKTVTVASLSSSGTDGANYSISNATATDIADITAKSITVSATAANKIYDASTAATATLASAGIIAGDTVALSSTTATFADKNVGTAKTVTVSGLSKSGTDAGNYVLTGTTATDTADITAKSMTINITADNKVYNATQRARIRLGVSGFIPGDTMLIRTAPATFSDKNVGTAKTVTVSHLDIIGTDAGNYVLTSTTATDTADITAKAITVSASNKVYDATTDAVFTTSGIISGDAVTLSGGTANFDTADVGTAKTVTVTGLGMSGIDALNYTLATTTTADITPKPITVSATPSVLTSILNSTAITPVSARQITGSIPPAEKQVIQELMKELLPKKGEKYDTLFLTNGVKKDIYALDYKKKTLKNQTGAQ